jgi:hypothetical protein
LLQAQLLASVVLISQLDQLVHSVAR